MDKKPFNPNSLKDKHDDFTDHLLNNDLFSSDDNIKKQAIENNRKTLKEKIDRKEERRVQTIRDARNKCRRLALSNFTSDDCFITLTYAKNMQDVKQADKDFKNFIKRLRNFSKQKIKYLAVREFQKRGAIHFHFLTDLKLPSWVKNENSLKEYERVIGDLWGFGFVDVKLLNKAKSKNNKYNNKPVDNVGAYLIKYMTKENHDIRLKEHKAYLPSRGLQKPYIYTEDEAKAIINAYNLDKKKEEFTNTYDSEFLGNITYKEYNLNRI